ncbi:MAG: primosomal protein N' [Acidobacteria bacterium]|nr:primosomal protein N' [Acidobacteriota bacterium]
MSRIVLVALPVPGLDVLSYEVPTSLSCPDVGARVLVPLGSRVLTGCVVQCPSELGDSAGLTLKPLLDVLDSEPLLPVEVVELACWAGEYYACGAGEAVAAAMPPKAWLVSERQVEITGVGHEALKGKLSQTRKKILGYLANDRPWVVDQLRRKLELPGKKRAIHSILGSMVRDGLLRVSSRMKGKSSGFRSHDVARLTERGVARHQDEEGLGRRQVQALKVLRESQAGVSMTEFRRLGIARESVKSLSRKGLVEINPELVERDPWSSEGTLPAEPFELPKRILTTEQAAAVRALETSARAGVFKVGLLHGVTGSGKTEVYLRLAKTVLDRQRQVLVLVPEIALTPAVAWSFKQVFGDRVAIQHSGLSEGVRHDQWQRIRRGEIDVVVGTRSAVFTPLPAIGLIVVDEEHDGSYKQEESPRYHARDVAIMRGKRCDALVLLGSATPSLESYQHATTGRYQKITLSSRVQDRELPTVQVVDMRQEFAEQGPDVVFSSVLVEALDDCLQRGEQALMLLNRRGFSTSVLCRQCGNNLECPNCSVTLTFHQTSNRARCHYCGYARRRPEECGDCGEGYLEWVGFGTEKVEDEIRKRWPKAKVARLDRDTTQRQGAAARVLGSLARGELDVLVGTQMVAKGHDFPGVTLVGVVSADLGLTVADFRAGERTFQLLTQVAGRAGRGERSGEAIIQTLYPNHYSIRYACEQLYRPFYEEELEFRRAMHYPPVLWLVCAVVRGKAMEAVMKDAGRLATRLRSGKSRFMVLGPAPAPITKLRGQCRVQLFLKGPYRREMREALLDCLAEYPDLKRRVMIDVDPLSML